MNKKLLLLITFAFFTAFNLHASSDGELSLNNNDSNKNIIGEASIGEFFSLNWNAIGDERQELEINVKTPYIFNTKITPSLLFNIYRQDSTFISTKFSGSFDYALNSKINLGITLESESSENTIQDLQNNNTSFNSSFAGLNFNYRISSNNNFNEDKLTWAKANEEQVWMYFIDKKLLFSTDTKLNKRFLENAPFSKFYMEQDDLSPGKIGVWMGWKIVNAFMENNDVSLQQLLKMDEENIFNKSKYKPKK